MGKKKGGKKGGKKGKKGGKKKEPQMTAKEAILAYQIGIIEKKLEDHMYEAKGWEEKNKKLEERNENLMQEQEVLIKHMLRQSKIADEKFGDEEVKHREDVVVSLKDKWKIQRQLEREIDEMKQTIADTEEEISRLNGEVNYCKDYRDKGRHENERRIKQLKEDLAALDQSFDEMKAHLERSDKRARDEISDYTENMLHKQKDVATQKAISKMDKYSQREVLDNEWLMREVELHRRDVGDQRKVVEDLERGNLEIMAELFECKIEDLKVSRNFFLTQFAENENLEESGILEMDLSKLSINEQKHQQLMLYEGEGDGDKETESKALVRPQSAVQKAVEEKVFALARSAMIESGSDSEESTETDLLDNMYFEEEDWDDYLRLGKLELKLLNITGQQMPIHVPEPPSEEEIAAKKCNPDSWPVTTPMLHKTATFKS
ncbi:hypothetical protein FSP39_006938 [Pinctada imbricata]|uniref:Coiled-coil domain-containing protein 83 n=1 Tax=Pinctada imbricata TaxID=66713 RepID=A0AA88YHS1_PINIB|nr:hypothetical protein FSP39_006938 [Pinctada imbricata]